jgi:hypothetical protein
MSKQPKNIRDRVNQNTNENLNLDATRPNTAKERQAKTEMKNLERMKKAREEKDRKNAFKVRGEPKSKPITENQMYENEEKKRIMQETKAKLLMDGLFSVESRQEHPNIGNHLVRGSLEQ